MIVELIEEYNKNKELTKESIDEGYLHSAKSYIDNMITIKETLEKQYNYYIRP